MPPRKKAETPLEEEVVVSNEFPEELEAETTEDKALNKAKRFVLWYVLAFLFLLLLGGTAFGIYTAILTSKKVDDKFNQLSAQITQLTNPAPTPPLLAQIQLAADAPRLGDKNNPVTIVEFADFQCPFCEKVFKTVLPQIKSQYVEKGKASFVFQDFAFLGPESTRAAEAAKCASDQGKFWEYHDKLYESQAGENQGAFSDTHLKEFAKALGLNTQAFNACLASEKYKTAVSDETKAGQGYGVTGTPTIFINGKGIIGAQDLSVYQQAIEEALKKK